MLARHRVVLTERELLSFLLRIPFSYVEIPSVSRAGHFDYNSICFGHGSSVNLKGRYGNENILAFGKLSSVIGNEACRLIGW